jgi:diguanylate cyclase (GGDEF)-like protein
LSSLLCVAAVIPASAQHYSFKDYGQAQGLKNLNVDIMLQDRDGFLWMGTDNGLFRFDGSRFQQIHASDGLKNPYVVAMAQDSSGRLWTGTGGGLFYRDGERFDEVLYKGHPMGVGLDSSLAALPDGRLLVVANYRLFVISAGADGKPFAQPATETEEFRELSSNETITSVLARGSEIWLGCGYSLCQFSDRQFRRWSESEGVPHALWYAQFSSRDGTLWVRNNEHILALPTGAKHFEDRSGTEAGQFTNNYYVSFAETSDGKIATAAAVGLALWKEGHWSFLDEAHGFRSSPLSSLLIDQEGRVWMGVVGHGVTRWLGYGEWENWTTADGLGNSIIWGMLTDEKKRIWVADDSGISVSDPLRKRFHSVTDTLKSFARGMQGITQDHKGNIWAVSGQGVLIRIDPVTLKIERYPDTPAGHQIYADAQDNIWISTEQGLYELVPKTRQPVRVDLAGTQTTDVYRVVEDRQGTLWAGSLGGLFERVNATWQEVSTDVPSLPTRFSDIDFAPDGTLWAVTDYCRVWQMTVAKGRIVAAKKMGPQEVSSEAAMFVRSDLHGRVWVGNDQGVDVSDNGKWRLFDTDDGLLWNDVNAKAFFADRDGSVWIGTSEGLSHYFGSSVAATAAPLPPHIDSVRYGSLLLDEKHFRTPWRGEPLEIDFSPLVYEHGDQMTYRYRLSDIDPDWITTDRTTAHYSPLPPGSYTFELMSVDPVSRATSPTRKISFTVSPRWWQTWISAVGVVMLAIACVLLAWRLRMRHLFRRQKELEGLVSARTRELEQLATRDALTGLLNRNRILELLVNEFARSRRTKTALAVVLLDIDYFKAINDAHGHLAGDAVLREIGRRFSNSAIRAYDSAGRYGGEEFLVLLPQQQQLPDVEMAIFGARLEKLKSELTAEPVSLGAHSLKVTCSIGVALVGGNDGADADDALAAADRALYLAKERGRNRIEYGRVDPVFSRAVLRRPSSH